MSTYAASAGLRAVVFVPEGAPAGKLIHLRTLGAKVFRVRKVTEGVDPTTTLLNAACRELGWTPTPSFGPFNCFQFEGTKSLMKLLNRWTGKFRIGYCFLQEVVD
jgi:threonine synthase